MKITGPDDHSFELKLEGYQFPAARPFGSRDERANRLNVAIEASIREVSWEAAHPCMSTWQVQQIAEWAERLLDPNDPHSRLLFPDPELTFHYGGKRSGNIVIQVNFGGDFLPPKRAYYNLEEDHVWAELIVPPDDLKAWADSLREALAKYPPR